MNYNLPEVGKPKRSCGHLLTEGGKGAWKEDENISDRIDTYSRYLAELLAIQDFLALEDTRVEAAAKIYYERRHLGSVWEREIPKYQVKVREGIEAVLFAIDSGIV